MPSAGERYAIRAEPYAADGGRQQSDRSAKRVAIEVRFLVRADGLEEARDKVRQVIAHGQEFHNGDIEWEWSVAP